MKRQSIHEPSRGFGISTRDSAVISVASSATPTGGSCVLPRRHGDESACGERDISRIKRLLPLCSLLQLFFIKPHRLAPCHRVRLRVCPGGNLSLAGFLAPSSSPLHLPPPTAAPEGLRSRVTVSVGVLISPLPSPLHPRISYLPSGSGPPSAHPGI